MKKTAVKTKPTNRSQVIHNAGLLSKQLFEMLDVNPQAALVKVKKILDKNPQNADLWEFMGRTHHKLNDFIAAEKAFNKALSFQANHQKALYSKAGMLYSLERFDEAEILINDAMTAMGGKQAVPMKVLLANVLQKQKKYKESIECFEQLILLEPDKWSNWSHLALIYQEMANFDKMHEAYNKAKALTDSNPLPYFNHIVSSHYDPAMDINDLQKLCFDWQKKFKPLKNIQPAMPLNKEKNKKLRIGMISDGFRSHPVGMMIAIGLSHVFNHEMEFYAYSTTSASDHITQRLQRITAKWVQVESISDLELNDLIRQHEIDILFDLNGYNSNSRMRTLQLKPAPIMVKWVGGLISSTGLEGMDYLLSDNVETHEGTDDYYTEKLIRLPVDYICYDPPGYLPPVSSLPYEEKGFITFGCFNNAAKINDVLLEQWALLLNDIPNSQLYLKSFNFKDVTLSDRIYTTLEKYGIKRSRIILEGASPHKELLESYNRVDIALDPWPYSGGLTTCEAMVMGVPVITLPGPTFAGRHSASHLVHAGMPELVAESWGDYLTIAKSLANDTENLALIRRHLREVLLSSSVCDGKIYARHFTDAMRAIWQRYCEGKLPAALSFIENEGLFFEPEKKAIKLNHPIEVENSSLIDNELGFSFNLDGQVRALDYGGILACQDKFKALMATNGIFVIIIDPLGIVGDTHLPLKRNSLQKVQMQLLGDGNDTQLNMCLDAKYSSDLDAITFTSKREGWYPQRVITKIKVPSLKLDEIYGLDRVDWLILDNRFNLKELFAYGARILKSCLFVAVHYRFENTHEGQLSFSNICDQLRNVGLDFHSFVNIEYQQLVEIEGNQPFESSQMIAAEALFIASKDRRAKLSIQQCEKLAFILHTGYGLYDIVVSLLQMQSKNRVANYIKEVAFDSKSSISNVSNKRGHSLPQKLIVSLTSYCKRFDTLHLTLNCLLNQTVKADRIILWIAESEKNIVPDNVIKFISHGLEIKYCKDIKSYKKIIPTLKDDPNSFIVTADDDLYYAEDWLENLIGAWNGDYKVVVAHRAHKIILDKNGLPVPYKEWGWEYDVSNDISSLNFPTSGAGVLYPPHCFYHDIINEELFSELSPGTDDIWLYWMCRMNGVKVKVVGKKMELLEWEGALAQPLWHDNLLNGGNDKNIKKMLKHYGFKNNEHNNEEDMSVVNDAFSFSHEDKLVCMHLPNKDDYIQNVIKSTGSFYEPEMLMDISSRAKKRSTILDVGANIGNHTIYFSLLCDVEKVISFEPQKNVYDTLCRNIRRNLKEGKVIAHQMGLGSIETKANLGEVDDKNIGMTKLDVNDTGEIRISTLDSVVEKEPVNSISVIKVDVEGMEMEVLRGAIKTLERHNPVLYIEAATNKEFDEISGFLKKFNYIPLKRFNATATYLFSKVN